MIKYGYHFTIDERGYIRMVVRYLSRRITLNVGLQVNPSKWDRNSQRCKRNTTHGKRATPAAIINNAIQEYENAVQDAASSFRETPTFDDFKHAVNSRLRAKRCQDEAPLAALVNNFLIHGSKTQTAESAAMMRRMINVLFKFRKDLTLEQINNDTLQQLADYITTRGLKNSTAGLYMTVVRMFLLYLEREGKITKDRFSKFEVQLKKSSKPVVFLTWDELMRLESADVAGKYAVPRDILCLCCFTGLRFSDAIRLRPSDIHDGAIHVITKKTNKTLIIELNRHSEAIVARYAANGNQTLFPTMTRQKCLRGIHHVCKSIGIDTPITEVIYRGNTRTVETRPKYEHIGTHCGRRTFICNALMMGIPPNIVMKWTGHSDYNAMRPYIDIADEAKKQSMELFNR